MPQFNSPLDAQAQLIHLLDRVSEIERRLRTLQTPADESLATPVPFCALASSVATVCVSGTNTQIDFDTVRLDTDGMASLGSNQIVFQTAGIYVVTLQAQFNTAAAVSRRDIRIYRPDSAGDLIGISRGSNVAAADALELNVVTIRGFIKGDAVSAYALQNSGGNVNIDSSAFFSPEMQAVWVSPLSV